MVEDTKMTDAEESKKTEEKTEDKTEESEAAKAPPTPPLEAAGLRLERLLGGGKAGEEPGASSTSTSFYTNPAKVVRRWLTTSCGAAGSATLPDIGAAAVKLLESCPEVLSSLKQDGGEAMETEADDTVAEDDAKPQEPTFLTVAARPYEAWLISLAVRCLYKTAEYLKAYALVQQGIDTVSAQFEDSRIVSSVVSAFYPLLARLIRWRSLVAEHMPASVVSDLRSQMAHAYNTASLRRDADTQATLLNCMLRDLLHSSQSKWLECWIACLLVHLLFLYATNF